MSAPLKHTTIPLDRAWNTWDGTRPAEMVFLPLGLRVTPMAYAASTKKATMFPAGAGLRFGARTEDRIEAGLSHAGTELDFSWQKAGPFEITGHWRTKKLGEWGLRFWMVIALSSEDGADWTYDPETECLSAAFGHRHVAVTGTAAPLLVTAHESLDAIAAEYEQHGYWHLASRATGGTVMALRYHLEEMPELTFAVAIRDDAKLARGRANELLTQHNSIDPAPAPTNPAGQALAAIRDVLGWNTVFDRVNRRPYVSISRNWNQEKFGGFGVWLNDQQYAAYLCGLIDTEQARENLAVALAGETPQGNLPCLLTAKDAWVDRNQLPIGSFLLWLTFLRGGSRAMLEAAYQPYLRNHAWWWAHRDPKGSGLVSFGNSAVGTGLYRGTNIGARDESSMDNSPMHDGAKIDPRLGTLDQWDVGLNAMLALDAEMLARIGRELGDTVSSEKLDAESEALKGRIRSELWDTSRGIFANRRWSGDFARSISPTSFWPLLCGAASPEQAASLLKHLADETRFGGTVGLPSVSRDDPAFKDNVYWRGRIWPPLNWTVWQGLNRYGFEAEAGELARTSWALFAREWEKSRVCAENYNGETGEALDQPDTDGFYSWGALMPVLAVAEVMDVSAWTGWTLRNDGRDFSLGPIATPIGDTTLTISKGEMSLSRHGRPVFATTVRGRIENLRITDDVVSFGVPGGAAKGDRVHLPTVNKDRVLLAQQNRKPLAPTASGKGTMLNLAPTDGATHVHVVLERPL